MWFVTRNTLGHKVLLCALLAIASIMLTALMALTMAEDERVVAAKEVEEPEISKGKPATATTYGLFNTAYALGILIGPLWGVGWTLISGISAISAFLMLGGWVGDRKEVVERQKNLYPEPYDVKAAMSGSFKNGASMRENQKPRLNRDDAVTLSKHIAKYARCHWLCSLYLLCK